MPGWLFKSDWDTAPRNPTWADFVNLAKDQGRAGFGAWGGNVDAGGYSLSNLAGISGVGGMLGLGTTRLNLGGNPSTAAFSVWNATSADITVQYDGQQLWWLASADTAGVLKIGGQGTTKPALAAINITSGGNVGIWTASPAAVLHCARSADDGAALLRLTGAGFGYNFSRSPATGWLHVQGDQSGNNGFSFLSNLGVSRFSIDGATGIIKHGVGTTPVYADNAAAVAGGLTSGTQYRTSTGVRMEVI